MRMNAVIVEPPSTLPTPSLVEEGEEGVGVRTRRKDDEEEEAEEEVVPQVRV